jgi:hypothetical protein
LKERRRSEHTVRAYVATAHRFLVFLGRYRGQLVGARDLIELKSTDLRAFLAQRRAEGLGATSAARELSGVRAFLNMPPISRAATRLCRASVRRGGRGPCRGRLPLKMRSDSRTMPRRQQAPRGSVRATLRSCCCSTGPACASPKRCRSPAALSRSGRPCE